MGGTTLNNGLAPASVHTVLGSTGEPLQAPVRHRMQSRFQYDFSKVRIHRDGAAAASADAVGAAAYTVGSHIVFNARGYNPSTTGGRSLLAHELTHVVQQSAAPAHGPIEILPRDHPTEAAAETAAAREGLGAAVSTPVIKPAPARALQRRVIDDDKHVTCRATRPDAFAQIQTAENEAIRILQTGAEVARSRARVEPLVDVMQGESQGRHDFRDALWRRFHVNYENKTVRDAWLRLISRRFDWMANAIGRMPLVYRCAAPGVEPAGDCTDKPGSGIAWSEENGNDMQLCDAFWSFDQKRAVLHEWFHLGFGRVDCGFAPEFNTVCWDTFAREIAGEATPDEQVDCCAPPTEALPPFRGAAKP